MPGVSVRDVRVTGSSGTAARVDGPALLLAFHSECAQCLRVSPQWSEWLGNYGSSGVLAVSREDLGVAERYALDRGWNVAVGSVEVAGARGMEAALVSRTPWIYVVDADGVVQATGHGNRIEELGAMSQDFVEAHAPGRSGEGDGMGRCRGGSCRRWPAARPRRPSRSASSPTTRSSS